PELLMMLVFVAVFFGLGWEFDVSLPLLSRFAFHGGAELYGVLSSAFGFGALLRALEAARRGNPARRPMALAGCLYIAALWLLMLSPSEGAAIISIIAAGVFGLVFSSAASASIQLRTSPEMRGRVVALWVVAASGTMPVGGFIVGWAGEHLG